MTITTVTQLLSSLAILLTTSPHTGIDRYVLEISVLLLSIHRYEKAGQHTILG